MSAWQPIETAPREYPLLLWDPYYLMRIGQWEFRDIAEIKGRGGHLREGEEGYWRQYLPCGSDPGRGEVEERLDPTYWMPLPRPPVDRD